MLDSLEEAILLLEQAHRSGDNIDLEQVVDFIIGQQIRYGQDAGIFVESRNVSRSKVRVYTGEKIQTYLAAKNILTIESTRALVLTRSSSESASSSIAIAASWLENQCFSDFCVAGECKHSTVAFMRYLNALGTNDRLDHMISKLSKFRDGKGGWTGFPYFFTFLALAEIESQIANDELYYALTFAKDRFKRNRSEEPFISRRNEILTCLQNRFGQSLLSHV
ncbi:MAG: hypothetical protein E4H14_12425 [Candidatus Thorarchaeota archaeon]|nr:MAG: hypothetical protein E4H14_12425 [Candidatus Thorarchaeota archaeon]